MQRIWLAIVGAVLTCSGSSAGELPDYEPIKLDGVVRTAVGVTRRDTPITAFVAAEDRDLRSEKLRVVLIGGFDGHRRSVDAALEALHWFYTHEDAAPWRKRMTLAVVPCGNPDGVLLDRGDENGQGGRPGDPPPADEKRYHSQTQVESQYLASWLAQHGADRVLELRVAHPSPRKEHSLALADGDVAALLQGALDKVDTISPAHAELTKRVKLDDRAFATQLLTAYSHVPKSSLYFDTLPLLANRRLAKLGVKVAEPDFPVPQGPPKSGSDLSGLLFVVERLKAEADPNSLEIVKRAANMAFAADGQPLAEPPFHNEMSDAVFMNGPLLSGVGALTGDTKYFDCCAQHQTLIRKLCQRKDGLYRHSPLDEAAWGRGNGFAALGMALMLDDWPAEHPERKVLLQAFRSHMAALRQHQDYTGTWHQVIDRPESYREFTGTSMIGFAMARGIRGGWLEAETYQPCVDRAWQTVKARTSPTGGFVDVCTGTGKQKTLRDYYDRQALQGRDGRGGSMALLFASEILRKP